MQLPRLSKEQEKLKGKKIVDMTDAEISVWIRVCELMETAGLPMKPRRSWKEGKLAAENEQRRRRHREPLG